MRIKKYFVRILMSKSGPGEASIVGVSRLWNTRYVNWFLNESTFVRAVHKKLVHRVPVELLRYDRNWGLRRVCITRARSLDESRYTGDLCN